MEIMEKEKEIFFGTIKCNFVQFLNVLYVRGLKHNLISISELCDADYEVHFNRNERKCIYSNHVTILSRSCHSDIYILDMFSADNSLRSCFFSHSQYRLNWLWHKSLSHLKFQAISKI